MWHTHVDWKGDGNQSVEASRPFLHALFRVFEKIEMVVSDWKKPAQTWVIIGDDSSQDAVYLHTPNPNNDNFPYSFEGVVWNAKVPNWLMELVDPNRHETGRCVYNGVVSFWIRSKRL